MIEAIIVGFILLIGVYIFTIILITEYVERRERGRRNFKPRTDGPMSLPDLMEEEDDDE